MSGVVVVESAPLRRALNAVKQAGEDDVLEKLREREARLMEAFERKKLALMEALRGRPLPVPRGLPGDGQRRFIVVPPDAWWFIGVRWFPIPLPQPIPGRPWEYLYNKAVKRQLVPA